MKYKLSEIGKVVGGGTPSTKHSEYYTDSGIPWLTPKDLSGYDKMYISKGGRDITQEGLENSSAKLLPANSILVSSRAPIGYVAIAKNEVATNQGFKSIIPNRELVIPEYLYFVMQTSKQDLEQIASGSTFKEVSTKVMSNFEVEIPSLDEQNKVLDYLLPITRKIEKNSRINANLLNLANTLFKHYFPDINTGTDKIGDYIKNFDKLRKPLSKKQRSEIPGKYRYIGATSVNDHIDKYNFDGIYLLLGEDGTVQDEYGFPILQYTFGKFWPNNHAHVLQGKNVSTEWLYLYFSQRNISGIVTGAVQKKVSQKNMNSLKFKLPDSQELKKFDKIIQPLFSKIRSTKLENYQLEELKRVLLTKLF
ncbi:restriction endonuclease subunit S [Limosilactobacillus fermentum]|uniref:restriction endonuclease subunit S n=1 Tax=Limosilactobacillus fermentum TaxID=1613 RepID=UPI001FB61D96|nr:restriction endonuclease subunit S [Limosilactobacillus fermentum]UOG12533.1 restriction endonuclease subunit S [Limosilactobacillus fermentum]